MPFASHRGQEIHYTVAGSGPTVVFQHGILSNAATWTDLGYVPALADAYRLGAVITLVDPIILKKLAEKAMPFYDKQIALADVLVLNKSDLAGADATHAQLLSAVGDARPIWMVSTVRSEGLEPVADWVAKLAETP